MTTVRASNGVRNAFWACVIACSGLTALLMPNYPGSPATFAVFNLSYFLLIGLAVPPPRMYGYTFLAALLFLGFWLKVVVHSLWAPGFIEPVGNFIDTPQAWDAALAAASCGALGVMLPRLIHLFASQRARAGRNPAPHGSVPAWYRGWRRWIWLATMVSVVALNLLNLHFAFYQVGVNPKLILPAHLNVLAAWLVNGGFALWISMLVFWDLQIGVGSFARNLLAPLAEALLSSISSMSRLMYLLHAGPYWIAILEKWSSMRALLTSRSLFRLMAAFAVAFGLSILVVFWLRVSSYYAPAGNVAPEEPVGKHTQRTMRTQLPQLLVHRWVGLEGVLAVTSVPHRNGGLLINAITENPKSGGNTLFQRVAKTNFLSTDPEKFTFLSNAGPVAILAFAGSNPVIVLGMSLLAFSLLFTEWLANRWLRNPLFLSVAGAGLANVYSQMTFPYLSLVFLLQLWVAIAVLATLQRGRAKTPAPG